VVNLVLALTPVSWHQRLAILVMITLLAYFGVYTRARQSRRSGTRFPLGFLIFCLCSFLGFIADQARGPFLEYTLLGLIAGALLGGLVTITRALTAAALGHKP
jgi:hypothetical protein